MASKAKLGGSTDRLQRNAKAEERDPLIHPEREQEIRRRAYEIYLERGAHPGRELEDWLQAERELTANQPNVQHD